MLSCQDGGADQGKKMQFHLMDLFDDTSFTSLLFLCVCFLYTQTLIMVAVSSSLLLNLVSASAAWKIGAQKCDAYSHYVNYSTVPGFFLQDEASTDASTFDFMSSCHPARSLSRR